MVEAVRATIRGGPFALSFEAGPQRRRAAMPQARRRTHRRGPGLDHENREEREVSRPIPDRTPSRRGARHRATWSRVCRACADNGLAPRARRSEAPGYAWLGEHARAVAARRTAPGPSARHHHQAGGPKGPCRDVLVPARWACGCRGKSGCRCPGESDLCPYSRLICNGTRGHGAELRPCRKAGVAGIARERGARDARRTREGGACGGAKLRERTVRENTRNTTPDALSSVTVARNDARESRVLRDIDPTR